MTVDFDKELTELQELLAMADFRAACDHVKDRPPALSHLIVKVLKDIKIRMDGNKNHMGRPRGAKNRRTLMREAQMCRAAQEAAERAAGSNDPYILLDCLSVMERAMSFFYTRAERAKDDVERDNNYLSAVAVAKEIAPYGYPRLATARVGS